MVFRLRTLLIVAALGPPVLAGLLALAVLVRVSYVEWTPRESTAQYRIEQELRADAERVQALRAAGKEVDPVKGD